MNASRLNQLRVDFAAAMILARISEEMIGRLLRHLSDIADTLEVADGDNE